MSTKKRFSISQDLATGIRNTIQSASSNQGQLHYDMMALDMIEPDPENPRKLTLTREDLLHGLTSGDTYYQTKAKELEALNELAESIKRIGIRNAIEVYKMGSKYRIVSGERRYLAALLIGHKSVPVRISQKPDDFNLRYIQWVENINRQDLSLTEKLNNLISLSEAYRNSHHCDFNERDLQAMLGISTIQAYRYFCLLKADSQVRELIESGKLNNLKIVQELVSMKDKCARSQIIAWILSCKQEVTTLATYRSVAGKKATLKKPSKKQSINLGKITDMHVAKQLLEMVLADRRLDKYRHAFQYIDWSNSKSIEKAFKVLFKMVEETFSLETA